MNDMDFKSVIEEIEYLKKIIEEAEKDMGT